MSIEIVAPRRASSSTTKPTRPSSSSGVIGSAPGRVDSPPTSTIAAPAVSCSSPRAIAMRGSKASPPSENESGVTLTTPTTAGRGNASSMLEMAGHGASVLARPAALAAG